MKKGLTIIAAALFISACLLSSCGPRQLCPAYTDSNETIELMETES